MHSPLRFETPEQIEIEYEVARLGSRFIAGLWDHLILFLLLFAVSLAGFGVERALGGSIGGNALIALLALLSFVLYWGYFVLFESIWDGQTPGKRLVSLRVIRRDGYPIGLGQSATRNLVRLIDIFPGSYGVGIVVMFFDAQARRLGDLAAGTIVVHDRRAEGIGALRATASRDPALMQIPLSGLHHVSTEEVELARRLLQRRGELNTSDALAWQLAGQLRPRLGPEVAGLNDVALLQRIIAQHGQPRPAAQMTGLPSL